MLKYEYSKFDDFCIYNRDYCFSQNGGKRVTLIVFWKESIHICHFKSLLLSIHQNPLLFFTHIQIIKILAPNINNILNSPIS